jgi:tetratricopeptide (TPR) repeat protein
MDTQQLMREAQLLFVEGKEKESIEVFTKAIEAGADPYIAHLSRGVAHVKTKEVDMALEDFSKAVSANNKSARAHFFRGMAYMMKEEFENAVSDFTQALKLKTDYAMAKFARAVSYARMDKFEESSKDMMVVMPQMEENFQGFADSYGIIRTEMWNVMSQISGEEKMPTLGLSEKDITTLKKWLAQE